MKRLSEAEFTETFCAPMQRIGPDDEPPFDFWPYFDLIPPADFGGYDCGPGAVSYVYRAADGRHEHVLVKSDAADVFMALVLDRIRGAVVGHHLLNLPRLYGVS